MYTIPIHAACASDVLNSHFDSAHHFEGMKRCARFQNNIRRSWFSTKASLLSKAVIKYVSHMMHTSVHVHLSVRHVNCTLLKQVFYNCIIFVPIFLKREQIFKYSHIHLCFKTDALNLIGLWSRVLTQQTCLLR